MRHHLQLIFLGLSLFGCRDFGSQPQDDILRQALISQGIPSSEDRFFSDGTFSHTSEIVYTVPPPADTLKLHVTGSFSVEGGILRYSNPHCSYSMSSGHPRHWSTRLAPYALEMHNGSLRAEHVEIFSPLGQPRAQLVGEWSSSYWLYWASDTSFTPEYAGTVRYTYDFLPDSTLLVVWRYPDNPAWPTRTDSLRFRYDPPFLRIGVYFDTALRVAFNSGNLFLFHDTTNFSSK
jgi:hypothetical protein